MKPPHWLDYVLAINAHLDTAQPDGRAHLAFRIMEAMPRAALEVAIASALIRIAKDTTDDTFPGPAELAHTVAAAVIQIWESQ